ncbi:uncharacterized protein [Dysidea avara]|uniref:uncharacterized protein n=1 Tax=Dysidea avara TaxID=196820 RepID=UPI00332EEA92
MLKSQVKDDKRCKSRVKTLTVVTDLAAACADMTPPYATGNREYIWRSLIYDRTTIQTVQKHHFTLTSSTSLDIIIVGESLVSLPRPRARPEHIILFTNEERGRGQSMEESLRGPRLGRIRMSCQKYEEGIIFETLNEVSDKV